MASKEHVKLLKRGAKAIAKWRKGGEEVLDLTRADLQGLDLRDADLSYAIFENADLEGASFVGADLTDADFTEAHLESANFSRATLIETDFHNANLMEVDFSDAEFGGAHFESALLCATKFIGVNLSGATDLDLAYYAGPSIIDIKTLMLSGGHIPGKFLRGCGVPDTAIAKLPLLFGAEPMERYSCFISYSHKDEEFCRQLYERLLIEKLSVFYASENMKSGRKLHEQIYRAISKHDKLLLVLSESSMASEWVGTEIYKARERERKEGSQVLFPIRLVPMEKIETWERFDADTGKDMAREIREYFIQDFSDWTSITSFELSCSKLLDALKKSDEPI